MILLRQPVSDQQDQVDHPPDPTCCTDPSTPSSPRQRMPRKTMSGLSAACLGFLLSLGFAGGAALGACVCDEQILGKEYCDQLCATRSQYMNQLNTVRKQVNSYGWDVCNQSSSTVYAAYASAYEGYGYTRKGWYTVNPGSCQRVLSESMGNKKYAIRIEKSNGNSLTKQDDKFCMFPPQSDGKIYELSLSKCKELKFDSRLFETMPQGNGFVTTVQ